MTCQTTERRILVFVRLLPIGGQSVQFQICIQLPTLGQVEVERIDLIDLDDQLIDVFDGHVQSHRFVATEPTS